MNLTERFLTWFHNLRYAELKKTIKLRGDWRLRIYSDDLSPTIWALGAEFERVGPMFSRGRGPQYELHLRFGGRRIFVDLYEELDVRTLRDKAPIVKRNQ